MSSFFILIQESGKKNSDHRFKSLSTLSLTICKRIKAMFDYKDFFNVVDT
jgi:hypothetical protein